MNLATYFQFAANNWRMLLFGVLLSSMAGFGQTYTISLFGVGLRSDFTLSDGALATLYAAATLAAALTLPLVGPWIGRTSVKLYTAFAAVLLACSALLAAVSLSTLALAISLYGLRLAGQCLLPHTAITITARAMPTAVGTALSLIGFGIAIAQSILPITLVACIAAFGWRGTWVIVAVVALGVIGCAQLLLLPVMHQSSSDPSPPRPGILPIRAWSDPRFWLTAPALLAESFIFTAFLFHQARLASEKGWALEWFAGWFVVFTVTQMLMSIVAGPLIDKLGASRLAPLFLLPQALGLIVLALASAPWAALAYLMLTAISVAMDDTLRVALWVERYGSGEMAGIRSKFEAVRVMMTGLAPVATGFLLDGGVTLSIQAGPKIHKGGLGPGC